MNILVCYKIVYEEQDIIIGPSKDLSFDRAELKLSLYDLNAVEEGALLAEKTGGVLKALSASDERTENSKLKKAVMSRGPQELFLVKDAQLKNADPWQTAKVLAAAAKKIGFDIILCGEGSGDLYSQQTGTQLGEILGLPVVSCVSSIIPGNGFITAERTLEDSVEVIDIPLPAVVSVTSDINTPRIPSMKEILMAGKKPVNEWVLSDIGISMPEAKMEILSIKAPDEMDRKRVIIEGDDKVAAFYELIKNDVK